MHRISIILTLGTLASVLSAPAVLAEGEESADAALEQECLTELGYGDRKLQPALVFWLRRCMNLKRKNPFKKSDLEMRRARYGVRAKRQRESWGGVRINRLKRYRGMLSKARNIRSERFRKHSSVMREGIRLEEQKIKRKVRARPPTKSLGISECMEKTGRQRWMCLHKTQRARALIVDGQGKRINARRAINR